MACGKSRLARCWLRGRAMRPWRCAARAQEERILSAQRASRPGWVYTCAVFRGRPEEENFSSRSGPGGLVPGIEWLVKKDALALETLTLLSGHPRWRKGQRIGKGQGSASGGNARGTRAGSKSNTYAVASRELKRQRHALGQFARTLTPGQIAEIKNLKTLWHPMDQADNVFTYYSKRLLARSIILRRSPNGR